MTKDDIDLLLETALKGYTEKDKERFYSFDNLTCLAIDNRIIEDTFFSLLAEKYWTDRKEVWEYLDDYCELLSNESDERWSYVRLCVELSLEDWCEDNIDNEDDEE